MNRKRIVVATALSTSSRAAHPWVELIATDETQVVLLHVDEWANVGFTDTSELIEYYGRLRQFRDRWLDDEQSALRGRGLKVQARTAEGTPAWHIIDVAQEVDADLIVISRSAKQTERRLLLGSTARRVCRHASKPVLAVPPGSDVARVDQILTTTDFSRDSARGLVEVDALARKFGAKVSVLHVARQARRFYPVPHDLPPPPPQLPGEMREGALAAMASELDELGLKFDTIARLGEVSDNIAKVADEIGADVIAIPTHGRGVARAAFGSTTEAVLDRAHVPVWVMPRSWLARDS